ncbi:hypothetical protein GQ600_8021 [Phytophthora cactorum]|nr:hypothetical protein GQ600_8021 [Phytophthora cactorum]
MQPQDPSAAALDASQAFNYDPASYQQYAQERALHDQAVHNSMAAVSGSTGSGKPVTSSASTTTKDTRLKTEATSASTSPTSVAKLQQTQAPSASTSASSTSTAAAKTSAAPARNESLKSNRSAPCPAAPSAHGGGRRCMVDGCERSSQGQGLCIRHGGGKRCTQPGCTKASQSNGLCKAHGGGLRCQSPGCTKSSQGGGFCRAHGGGQRCEKEGCNKGAQRGGFCAGHGGSRFCQHPDCTKNDRGGGFCAEHGGGKRCDHPACNKPARKKGKCSYHANAAKGKLPKDQLATAASLPQHMMDMRQITTPTFAMGVKDLRDAHLDPQRAAYVQQRVEMEMRYKGYEASTNAGQYLQIHADQRSYEPISLQAGAAARYHVPVDNGSLPPVSGSMYKPGAAVDQQMKNPYSQHWAAKPEMPHHHPDGRVDYFDVNKEQQQPPQQQPGHHHPYPAQSSQYHHHLSAADSAAAAAAYGQQQGPRGYYSQQATQGSASADQPGTTNILVPPGAKVCNQHHLPLLLLVQAQTLSVWVKCLDGAAPKAAEHV